MTQNNAEINLDERFCLGCGYALRGLQSRRCPECGRAFNPDDPATMSIGRPLRGWQRAVLRPTSWALIFLALLGTGLLVYLSGRLGMMPEPWSILKQELAQPFRPIGLPALLTVHPPPRHTLREWLFCAFWMLWGVFLLLSLPKSLLRLTIPRAVRRMNIRDNRAAFRKRVVAAAAIATGVYLIFGWTHRIGEQRIVNAQHRIPYRADLAVRFGPGVAVWPIPPPFALTRQQCSDVLSGELAGQSNPATRLLALGLLLEQGGRTSFPAILHAAEQERDENVLKWELRAIGLFRDPSTEALLTSRLDDPRPEIRAAAIDALGILRHPSYSVLKSDSFWIIRPLSLDIGSSAPLVDIVGPATTPRYPQDTDHDLVDDPPVELSPSIRGRFERIMLHAESTPERQAAARALVAWPPEHYHLRVAEWGVWIADGEHLALARSIIDEIPPFVHRTGNALADLDDYFRLPSVVTKPIIHVTSDVPLAMDMQVAIGGGRPWFAYPAPDDFAVEVRQDLTDVPTPVFISGEAERFKDAVFNDPAWGEDTKKREEEIKYTTPPVPGALADCRNGYPWLTPHHELYDGDGIGYGRGVVWGLGCRWQSVIVSPQKLSGMTPPIVPGDPRFQWWERLRQVPSDWMWNRGETERFLYYDGPTLSQTPVKISFDASSRILSVGQIANEQHVNAEVPAPDERERDLGEMAPSKRQTRVTAATPGRLPTNEGFFIEVRNGAVAAERITLNSGEKIQLPLELPLRGVAVAAEFRRMVIDYGLTEPEADGLMASWSPWLFHAEGKRFILRMAPSDYDQQCPMWVRPKPSEVVRLGLVLSEFGKQQNNGG
jgi:hypothetical protein